MAEKVLKIIRAEVKDIDKENHTLTAVISNKKVDRDGDIVMPEAFKNRLKNYKDHPVLLSSHNYMDLRKQIGKAVSVDIGDNEVTAKFEYFVNQGNEEADWAWVLAQKGIASYSIGFIGHTFDWIKEKDGEGNERVVGRKFTDIELLEVSQVLVPSNRGALQSNMARAQEELELCEAVTKAFDAKELVETKPVDVTENYIRVRIRNPDIFVDSSFRTIDFSKAQSIKAIIGKLKSDPQGSTHIQSILFDKDKWSVAEAKKWVEDHLDELKKNFEDSAENDSHYSSEVLGEEVEITISEPQSTEIGIEDIKATVKKTVAKIKES
jgi:HK97 family phage prohead protease